MNDTHLEHAANILKSIHYATVATTSPDGQPWNSPVAHVADEDLNIYWFSDKQNQHSQNVRSTGRAFIVIYDSTVPEGSGEGVYIQATVKELQDPSEIVKARRLKKGANYNRPADEFLGDAIRRVYKATPQNIWVNDAEVKNGTFIRDYRVELDLVKLRTVLHETV